MRAATVLRVMLVGLSLVVWTGCPSDYNPPPQSYRVSGTVEDEDGQGIDKVLILIDGSSLAAVTNSQGVWSIPEVFGMHKIVPAKDGYVFDPADETVKPGFGPVTGVDFVALYRPYYPDTPGAPSLLFQWPSQTYGALKLTDDATGHIYACGRFGFQSGSSRTDSMKILLAHRKGEAIYAPCAGAVMHVKPWSSYSDAAQAGKGGEIWIRYGRNYAVAFRHIVTTGTDWDVGDTIQAGDVVGYTADRGSDGSYFEMLLARRQSGKYYYMNPFYSISFVYQGLLTQIWNAAQDENYAGYDSAASAWGTVTEFEAPDGGDEIKEKGGL